VSILSRALLALASVGLVACAPGWRDAPAFLADPRRVAEALGDPPPPPRAELDGLPWLRPPAHMRPCCVLGLDLHAEVAGVTLPFFTFGSVLSVDALGGHAYTLAAGAPEVEGNGVIYTCRGGWIDTGHLRQNADMAVYLSVSIARSLERGTTIDFRTDGAATTVQVDAIPEELLAREGPMDLATTLAAWAAYRISIWHEIASWYGAETIPGISERLSTFSPEDLYSNVLGIRLGVAVLEAREIATDDDYAHALMAYAHEALERLDAVPLEDARAIMTSLDGRWWDSSHPLPEVLMIPRRAFPAGNGVVVPWRAEQAFEPGEVPAVLAHDCGEAPTRSLRVREHVGSTPVSELVHITWRPEGWADASFPFPDPESRAVSERDLDALVETTRDSMREVLGAHFDERRGPLGPHPSSE
jgi:hypothetical protein